MRKLDNTIIHPLANIKRLFLLKYTYISIFFNPRMISSILSFTTTNMQALESNFKTFYKVKNAKAKRLSTKVIINVINTSSTF